MCRYITQLTNNLEEKLHWVTRMSQRAELLDSKVCCLFSYSLSLSLSFNVSAVVRLFQS